MLLGVDVGGTFTDAVLATGGRLVTAKAPSTPGDQSAGVLAAVSAVLAAAGAVPAEVAGFAHGTTVATNALLEGHAARTTLVATEGFADVVELGRQARQDLYRLCAAGPAPLVPPERRIAAPERAGPEGILKALAPGAAAGVAAAAAATEPEAVAVVLLHSYRHPEHELALGAALANALPGVHVSLSHEIVGTFREYERAATTELDAAISPLLGSYLRALLERAGQAGLPTPAIMQSNGGLTDAETAAAHAALTVLSGPAGGAAGAAFAAAAAGHPDVLCFDMGGTSCDVCVVDGGRVRETGGADVGGRPVALPALDLHTVGAGGGSVAWRDPGGALRVGPRSAGADPGPAAYGRGGTEPTVTDANLVLGYLDPELPLAGGVELDREAAERAVGTLGAALGLEPTPCAEGIVRVANAAMAGALRVVTVRRGVDPRAYALLAFGGAGPMHAAAIADELGMDAIVCPRASGVLAALGLVVSERRRDAQRSVLRHGASLTDAAVAADVAALADTARAGLGLPGAEIRTAYDLRYRGQSFERTVRAGGHPPGVDALRAKFVAAHQERFGFTEPDGAVELVTVRATAAVPGPGIGTAPPAGAAAGAAAPAGTRPARFGGVTLDAAIWPGGPAPGAAVCGPAVCAFPEATLVVPPAWQGEADDAGTLVLRRTP